ncbi:MAG: tRNA guanosine(34) transglycosylase Tgt [Candidatus Wallbacteria bacterium HGW-Wallbacteria-1]|uniref:Queuine tRNA-ribosyltransferase n=1 Tax=Candidatus Wallbacteria bacterium HGW-Wallbacteria-1 TaxID=2013854 RepID=A0A2N1PTY4_9BACT|nr:MAG: tRNA guanosine(34) transglycosylase Tgt [Candidatus Wallbacteria bacterium HGW-Wallbacteria-1]
MSFRFELIHKSSKSGARAGRLHTPHGIIDTPAFMPVGTVGSVKTLSASEMGPLSEGLILGNTYHLYLRPGLEVISQAGGLHNFIGWNGAILTDSGGFQVFSLAKLRKITEDGVEFASHIDGSRHMFTPEKSMEIQKVLGSDIMMAFDECVPFPCDRDYVARSIDRTARWAERCAAWYSQNCDSARQTLFPIVQGGMYPDLRLRSVEQITSIEAAAGYAIGGLSVGESREEMLEVLSSTAGAMPENRARYLMGVGTPDDFRTCISQGVDLFDCVMPTRVARHGCAYTDGVRLNMKAAVHEKDFSPIDPNCTCLACRHHTRAYIRHLFKAGELLSQRLLTVHNLTYFRSLVASIRQAILDDQF